MTVQLLLHRIRAAGAVLPSRRASDDGQVLRVQEGIKAWEGVGLSVLLRVSGQSALGCCFGLGIWRHGPERELCLLPLECTSWGWEP